MKEKSVEFRPRSKRAPEGFRIFLGSARSSAELKILYTRRDLCKRLALRGEWDALQALKDKRVTIEELERLIDHHGIDDYRAHLSLTPEPTAPTLDDHVARFLDGVEKRGTRNTYRIGLTHLRNFTVDGQRLGARPWHRVQAHHVRDLRDDVLGRLARATTSTYLGSWSAFFEWAVLREESEALEAGRPPLLEVNPVHKARSWVRVQPTRHRFLTHDEYAHLIETADEPMRAQYATLTLCGLRGGELRNLPPGHVSLDRIEVGPWGSWEPKTARGTRVVPVHQTRLRPLLEEYEREHAGDVMFFVNPNTGDPWTEGTFRQHFYRDAKAAGLVVQSRRAGVATPEGVTPHTLRHTFASWLVQADVQLLKVAQLMGDTEPTVRAYYAHLLPSDLDQSVHRLFSMEPEDE